MCAYVDLLIEEDVQFFCLNMATYWDIPVCIYALSINVCIFFLDNGSK